MDDESTVLGEVIVTGTRIRGGGLTSASPLIMAEQGELGDYKIYTLPGRTDVSARQTKQVRFLDRDHVRFTRLYRETIQAGDPEEAHPPQLLLRLRNEAREGLGTALPGGGVALMEMQAGRALFTGQAYFEDRPVGLPVEFEFGQAMDLTISHESESSRDQATGLFRHTVRVTVRNDKPAATDIEIVPAESGMRDFRIVQADAPSIITDAGSPAWRLRTPGRGGTRILTYTIEYRY